jgi:hypothetical protein
VLVEAWQQEDDRRQIHLVNYAGSSQPVKVCFEKGVRGQVLSPDTPAFEFQGGSLELILDIYSVLLYE